MSSNGGRVARVATVVAVLSGTLIAVARPAPAVTTSLSQPAITTTASPTVPLGGQIHDTAALRGGLTPTGTITFTLYGPNDVACTVPAFTGTVPVLGNGNYASPNFTVTQPGTYRFRASYSGDLLNNPAGPTACLDPAETVIIRANPAIATLASAATVVGGTIFDTATLSGTIPTGTITFKLFGPNNATCAGTALATSTVPVQNGMARSQPFATSAAGTYHWVASYSGDANNNPAGPTACNDPAETVVVSRAQPALTTVASPSSTAVGEPMQDTATLVNGVAPTGTITFNLFGPNNPACTGTPVFTSTVAMTGGNTSSAPFTAALAGTYHWVASYSGDANNNPAGPTACTDPAESVVVAAPASLPRPLLGDFTGDGLTDIAVWRPDNGTWYVRGFSQTVWGQQGDIPVPADYAGDLRSEIAVFRPSNGTWYVRGVSETVWGQPGDIPVPADYNGDGKADIAVYRPANGTWYVKGISETHFGLPDDIPVPADYAGDAKAEIAVFRPSNGTWYIQGVSQTVWGQSGDIPVPANYGGDGKADIAVYRPANGTWYVKGISETRFGLPGDVPVPGDYNGVVTHIAVWRPSNGTWFIRGVSETVWGQPGDTPV